MSKQKMAAADYAKAVQWINGLIDAGWRDGSDTISLMPLADGSIQSTAEHSHYSAFQP